MEALTVPTNSRLSFGVEIEALVAYVQPSEVDPDEEHSVKLAPLLRIDAECDDDSGYEKVSRAIKEHIRQTFCSHGINAQIPADYFPVNTPYHTLVDHWDVHSDVTIMDWKDEAALTEDKKGDYRWFNLELCSPAFWDEAQAYDEVRFVMNVLKSKYRVRVNHSCGFHIHVGNGSRFFDARTLKRTGAFLFAADPMLSRLHAPHRRVIDHCESIRYGSRLACLEKFTAEDVQELIDKATKSVTLGRDKKDFDMLPIRPWSDRSREEVDFGGKEGWEKYAKERRQYGPFITLGGSQPSQSDAAVSKPSSLSSSSSSSSTPPSPSLVHRNNPVDRASTADEDYLRFQELMANTDFRGDCYIKYGDRNPQNLPPLEISHVLSRHWCEQLFGHKNLNILTKHQLTDVEYACKPYKEIARREWRQKASLEGAIPYPDDDLEQPCPFRITEQVDHARLEAMAEEISLQQRQEAHLSDSSSDEFSDDENQIQRCLYNRLDELMKQPTFPLESVDSLLAAFPLLPEKPKDEVEAEKPPTEDADGLSSSPVSSVPMDTMSTLTCAHESEPSSVASSPFIINTESSKPALTCLHPCRISQGPTLLPHDPNTLPESYKQRISSYVRVKPHEWQRVNWLPRPANSALPGPRDPISKIVGFAVERKDSLCNNNNDNNKNNNNNDNNNDNNTDSGNASTSTSTYEDTTQCTPNARTDTRSGIARLLGPETDSGAAVAALLTRGTPGSRRLNYNFRNYLPESLVQSPREKRTIEFREAGGTLDDELAATLAKIAVGIVRFCRDAGVGGFLEVLERIVCEEERLRRVFDRGGFDDGVVVVGDGDGNGNGNGGEKEVVYDVCDLLEDLGLFAEATIIRNREARFGPPR